LVWFLVLVWEGEREVIKEREGLESQTSFVDPRANIGCNRAKYATTKQELL